MALLDPDDANINEGFNVQKNQNRGNARPPGPPANKAVAPEMILSINTGYNSNPILTDVLDLSYAKYTIKNDPECSHGCLELSGKCLPLTLGQRDTIISALAVSYRDKSYLHFALKGKAGIAAFTAIHMYAMYEDGVGNNGAGVCLKLWTTASSLTMLSNEIIVVGRRGGQLYRGPEIVNQNTPVESPMCWLIWNGNVVKEVQLENIIF